MSDDMKQRGAQDRARININEEHEVRYWTDALGVSKQQLAEAVQAVGVSADKVRAHLGKR
jgi:CRISPR/Cas system-associated endonuclease Cas3-HD